MSGEYVMCMCWCDCRNDTLVDDYDTRDRNTIVCGDCAKGSHVEETE